MSKGSTPTPKGPTVVAIRQELLDDVDRWSPELQAGMRSTLWHGVFAKTCQQAEALLKGCASSMVSQAGDAGIAAVLAVGGGKPVAAMTMGQNVDLVRTLSGGSPPRG